MQSVVTFFKNIYEHELTQSKSLHLFSGRVLKRYHVSQQEEILTGEYPYIPISDKQGEEIVKTLELKSNEISLKYYAFGRVSRFISLKKHESTRIYPLLAYNAEVVLKDGAYYLHIDMDSRELMKNHLPRKVVNSSSFRKVMISPTVDFHFASKLNASIKKNTEATDVDELLMFPELWPKKKINAELKSPFKVSEKYIPLGILAIVEKENNSFTTLNELNEMTEVADYSAPIKALFNKIENRSEEKQGIICEELNNSQYQSIENSNNKIISVISGPPGTGKSFTIANLAAEKVSKGQSILITSKNKEALTVIEEKIKDQLGIKNLCINPSRDEQFYWMKEHLDHVLGRQFKKKNYGITDIENANKDYQDIYDKHLAFEKTLMQQFKQERDYVEKLNTGLAKNTSANFKNRIFKSREKTLNPLWKSLDAYYQGINNIRKKAVKNLQMVTSFMLEESVKKYRKELRTYLSFLRAREIDRKEKLAESISYNAVLKAFPVWLIRANDVSRVLPAEKEVFDILIIDEASQCDIPSILPLMQRAKKVVIVGDVKQLTHISFISKAFEVSCRSKVTLDLKHYCKHRDYSILHLAEEFLDPFDRVQLNEHFRSQFPIIAFSNKNFYQNNLDILTKRPVSVAEHVSFIRTEGKRTKGHHEGEMRGIIEKIEAIIINEKKLPNRLKTSIGILSPFRKQVDYLFSKVLDTFSLSQIKKHKIIVGTAFTFQGNERDLMLLSLSLDNDAVGGSFTFLNRKDVFNVSITRARNTQIIYHSFDASRLNSDSTLAHFFRFYERDLTDDLGRSTKDAFCLEISSLLENEGFKTWSNFEISGISIDLLIRYDNEFIGIDLIGFPGEMEAYYSLERYKMIERGKIKLFPLSYPQWLGNREKCTAAILSLIQTVKADQPVIPITEIIEDTNHQPTIQFKTGQVMATISDQDVKLYISKYGDFIRSIQLKVGRKIIARIDFFNHFEQDVYNLELKVNEGFDKKDLSHTLIQVFIDCCEHRIMLKTAFIDVLVKDEIQKALLKQAGFVQNDSFEAPLIHLSSVRSRMVRHFDGTKPIINVKAETSFKKTEKKKKIAPKNKTIAYTAAIETISKEPILELKETTISNRSKLFQIIENGKTLGELKLQYAAHDWAQHTGYLTLQNLTDSKTIFAGQSLMNLFNDWLIGTSMKKIYGFTASENLVQQELFETIGFVHDYNQAAISFAPKNENTVRMVKFIL